MGCYQVGKLVGTDEDKRLAIPVASTASTEPINRIVSLGRTQQDTATIFSWTRLIGGRLLIMRTSERVKVKRSHTQPSRRNFPKSSETLKTFDMMRCFQLKSSATLVRRRVTRLNHFHNTFRLAPKRPSHLPRRTTHWMSWLSRWPEIFLAVLVAALEAYRFGNTTTPMVSHAAWTHQRKLEMRWRK